MVTVLNKQITEMTGETSYTTQKVGNYPLYALEIYGKSTQNGTPTPDAPIPIKSVGDDGAVEVTACGKNLFEGSQDFSGNWINSSAWIDSEEKYNGLAVKYRTSAWNGIGKTFNLELNVPYTVSFYAKTNKGQTLQALLATNPNGVSYNSFGQMFTLTGEWTRYSITFTCTEYSDVFLRVGAAASVDAPLYVCGYQLEKNSVITEYEPYTENVAEITSGLPLCSVGDVRDELIYNADSTGKIVKQIKRSAQLMSSYGWQMSKNPTRFGFPAGTTGADVSSGYAVGLSEHFGDCRVYGTWIDIVTDDFVSVDEFKAFLDANEVYIIYPLAEPQEIKLSAAEMANLQQLQTFIGTTNIFNNENGKMYVKAMTADFEYGHEVGFFDSKI